MARWQGAMDSLERTLAEIRSKAAELRNSFGDEERAREQSNGQPPWLSALYRSTPRSD